MTDKYSQKEETTFRNELFRRMDFQDKSLEDIKTQTTKTNGRVNKHDWYFTALWWALGVIGVVLLYILPPIVRFVNDMNRLQNKITELTKNHDITK